ncbi:MAG: TrkA family potassium uptake protein [bacterium]|nr:TrkA family potassium uptake protein [bacterium]
MEKKSFLVIGLGFFGASVARTLYGMGHEVLGVDTNMEIVRNMMDSVTHIVQMDATDMEALRSLGVTNFDVVIVGRGSDLEDSIIITLNLKQLGARYVVAKALSDTQSNVLMKVGADRVVFPERDMGVKVAHGLMSQTIVDYIPLTTDYSIVEVTTPAKLFGKTLAEMCLRTRMGINILVIKRGNDLIVSPGGTDRLEEGDILIVMGREDRLDYFRP